MLTQHEDRKLQISRIRKLAGLVIALFFLLIARLWYLQIVLGEELLTLSESNRIRLLRTRAPRGTILDRNGRVLATSRPQFVVLATPSKLKQNPEALKTLCGVLGVTPSELDSIIAKRGGHPGAPARVKIDAPLEMVARISELRMKLPGVSVELDQIRHYPDGPAVAHIMGHLGEISEEELKVARRAGNDYRPGDYIGKQGLEKQYEKYLRGLDGGKQVEVNALGAVVRVLGEKPSLPGKTLRLAIDRDLQIAASRALGSQVGAAVAIDPRTGGVLAMVSSPAYDPNIFVKRVKAADWEKIVRNKGRPLQNRCVYNVYPPGSTFKPVTAIAGLIYNECNVNTSVNCPGSFYLGRHRFGCWRVHGHVGFLNAMAQSCDVWFYNLGRRLKIDRIAKVARQFGLGSATGIDLPKESRKRDGSVGTIPDTRWKLEKLHEPWWPGETISCSIGQGYIQVSPLQMAVMCGAVATGGEVHRPYLVEEIVEPNGDVVRRTRPKVVRKVQASKEAFELVVQGMRLAVTSGTGKVADIPDVAVAGKTGSAEDPPRPAHGWFICFAPVENPRIAVAAIVEHGRHGATSAAPVCRAILDVFFGKKKPQDINSVSARVRGD
ncbi:MAG: penicillin-binding protein 2 [Armatimonadetes bacterium]|nr:penicillin-binding protein 2 [Armatimonadota bacterium]